MKKLTLALLSVAMLLACCACGEESSTTDTLSSTAGESSVADTTAPAESADAPETTTAAPVVEEEEGFDLSSAPAVIYDANNVKITANPPAFDDLFAQWRMEFEVENNNDFEIGIDALNIIMNGYGFSTRETMSPIKAGETQTFNKGLNLRSTQLTKPAYATMQLVIENKSSRDTLDDLGEILLRFSDYGFEEPDKDTSQLLFDDAKVKLYILPDNNMEDKYINFKLYAVSSDTENAIGLKTTNPVANGTPYDGSAESRQKVVKGTRAVFMPFENFNTAEKYGIASTKDLTSLAFDLEVTAGSDDELGMLHVELNVGDTISIASVTPITAE